MRTLEPGNRNPQYGLSFARVNALLLEEGNGVATIKSTVGVGNQTWAYFSPIGHDDPAKITVCYFEITVGHMFDDDSVQIVANNLDETGWRRADWMLRGIGLRLRKVRGTMKVYSPDSGAYRDFKAGMTWRKGQF